MKSTTPLADILSLVCIPVAEHQGHFDVESRTDLGSTHRVRLRSSDGVAVCECADFLYQCLPNLEKGAPPFQVATMCQHIARAVLFEATRSLLFHSPSIPSPSSHRSIPARNPGNPPQ